MKDQTSVIMDSRKCVVRVIEYVCAFLLFLTVGATVDDGGGSTKHLLMIGNSYTDSHGLDNLVRTMLLEYYADVQAFRYSPGGQIFDYHVNAAMGKSGEDNLLRNFLVTDALNWTWVVLQEQSQIGGYVDVYSDYYYSTEAAIQLNNMVNETGGETIFFMTWGRRNGDAQNLDIYPDFLTMNARLAKGYQGYVEATSTPERPTTLAPVGMAFERVYRDAFPADANATNTSTTLINPAGDPNSAFYKLYSSDGSHPSLNGSYLAACVLYSTITGQDPQALRFYPSPMLQTDAVYLRSAAYRTMPDRITASNKTNWQPIGTRPPENDEIRQNDDGVDDGVPSSCGFHTLQLCQLATLYTVLSWLLSIM